MGSSCSSVAMGAPSPPEISVSCAGTLDHSSMLVQTIARRPMRLLQERSVEFRLPPLELRHLIVATLLEIADRAGVQVAVAEFSGGVLDHLGQMVGQRAVVAARDEGVGRRLGRAAAGDQQLVDLGIDRVALLALGG